MLRAPDRAEDQQPLDTTQFHPRMFKRRASFIRPVRDGLCMAPADAVDKHCRSKLKDLRHRFRNTYTHNAIFLYPHTMRGCLYTDPAGAVGKHSQSKLASLERCVRNICNNSS